MSLNDVTLDELWDDVPAPTRVFRAAELDPNLPAPARRYLVHAIAEGTPLASAVRLRMHGSIKLGDWLPFEAEQVIRWDRGLIWKATTKKGVMRISGSDRLIDGEGAMRWKLFGIVPVMRADGPDVSRSAKGRLELETLWLPSVLVGDSVAWRAEDDETVHACFEVFGDEADVTLRVGPDGRLLGNLTQRWGNPEGREFHASPFGGLCLDERTFDGFTIPTEVRVGWHLGTPRFEDEGEFFRGSVTSASFR